jgi:ABC-2 type transport system permease protein
MKVVMREPMSVFFTIAFAPLLMSLFGMIFGNKATPFYGGFGYIDASVAAYIGMTLATAGLMHLPVTVATYREKGILRRLKVTPLSPQAILGAQMVVMLLMTLIGTGLLIILGKAVFHLRFAGNVFSVAAGLVLSCVSFFTLGFVLAGLARSARVAQTASMLLYFPMLFLSGATIPLEAMPKTIRHISEYLPLTHVVMLLKGLWFGHAWSKHTTDVAVLAGMLVVGVIISAKTFRWE